MWWQKRIRLPYIAVILVVGMVLGSIPGIIGSIVLFQQRPITPWDSRPCIQIPSPETCNEILPYAPSDYIALHGKPPESGLCIDKEAQHWDARISDNPAVPKHVFGTLSLWWLPRCQSAYVEIVISIDLMNPHLLVTLKSEDPRRQMEKWLLPTSIHMVTEGKGLQIRTPLLWSLNRMVSACGTLILHDRTAHGCISPHLMHLTPAELTLPQFK